MNNSKGNPRGHSYTLCKFNEWTIKIYSKFKIFVKDSCIFNTEKRLAPRATLLIKGIVDKIENKMIKEEWRIKNKIQMKNKIDGGGGDYMGNKG